MGKKSQPRAPDPAQTIAAQSAANKEAITESARVNAVNQYGPNGSTTYQRDATGIPISQTVTLNPTAQDTFDRQEQIANGLTQKAGELAGRIPTGPMDISGLPQRQSGVNGTPLQTALASRSGEIQNLGNGSNLPALPGVGDFGAEARSTQDAMFKKAQALLQPGQQMDRSRLEQQLSDRGIPLDSAAGRAELTRMEQSQSEATNRAAYDAVAAGSAEQSRLFGLASTARGQMFGEDTTRTGLNNSAAGQRFSQDLGAAEFGNSAQQALFGQNLTRANFTNDQRTSALQEMLALRNQDFNEASALLQGAPVMGQPTFANTPTYSMQPVNASGIIQQDYANRTAAAQANNPMAGLFGLGSAAITAFSDRRLKRDVVPIGTGWRGLPLYLFRYVWGGAHQVGVMAQDAARVAPKAVHDIGRFLAVDYAALRGAA